MTYSIYKITNKVNKKIYIGLTKGFVENRLVSHFRNARCKTNMRIRLHQAIRKHGEEFFRIKTLKTFDTLAEAMECEIKLIAKYNARDYAIGYNMAFGGGIVTRTKDGQARLTKAIRKRVKKMTVEQRCAMTAKANKAKRGMTESDASRERKSKAQVIRWENTSEKDKQRMYLKRSENTSKSAKRRQVTPMQKAFSPVRQKGYQHPKVKCPHCGKIGGINAMPRFHFDRCNSL